MIELQIRITGQDATHIALLRRLIERFIALRIHGERVVIREFRHETR